MKSDTTDLGRLKWAIVTLVALCAFGGGTVWTALQWQKTDEKAFRDATAARSDVRAKLARAQEEQVELREKIARFQALRDRGYIGPEQRLDWIETIAKIKVSKRVQRLEYEFSPQKVADTTILPEGPYAGGFEVMASQMKLQVQLLHEGELLSLIDEIRNSVQALIQVKSCSIERQSPNSNERNNPAQLSAECIMEWITLRERK